MEGIIRGTKIVSDGKQELLTYRVWIIDDLYPESLRLFDEAMRSVLDIDESF